MKREFNIFQSCICNYRYLLFRVCERIHVYARKNRCTFVFMCKYSRQLYSTPVMAEDIRHDGVMEWWSDMATSLDFLICYVKFFIVFYFNLSKAVYTVKLLILYKIKISKLFWFHMWQSKCINTQVSVFPSFHNRKTKHIHESHSQTSHQLLSKHYQVAWNVIVAWWHRFFCSGFMDSDW